MALKLTFHGAARTVTGSCYLLENGASKVLIDCGMFQGSKTLNELNYRPFPFSPASLSALVLTHAHIDHTGVVPKLTKHGYAGKIHATDGTVDLCSIMLPDSGFIQETEVAQLNRRNERRGIPPVEPMYTLLDAQEALKQFVPQAMETWFSPAPGFRMQYWNAGHLLGSASVEVEADQPGKPPVRLLFSGDIGPDNKMLQHDPVGPTHWDYVVCESTYGGQDRFERSQDKRRERFAEELNAAAKRGGALLIPSFAVERTQEVVTDIVTLMEAKRVPTVPIFIDSPLANKASAIFRKHAKSLEHGEDLFRAFASPHVRATESVDDSKALNQFRGFYIVIAASGMAEAGRIRHHLRNHLWQRSTTVLFVGYQGAGTLGAHLESGAKTVRIMGEEVEVAATIRKLDDYSGHADGPELVQWIKERLPITRGLFLTHGEEDRQQLLAEDLAPVIPAGRILRPSLDECFDLSGEQAVSIDAPAPPRMDPVEVTRPDWHASMHQVLAQLQERLRTAPDDARRGELLRRVQAAIDGGSAPGPSRGRPHDGPQPKRGKATGLRNRSRNR